MAQRTFYNRSPIALVIGMLFSLFTSMGIAHAQLSPADTEEFISWVLMLDGANWSTTGNPPFPMNYDQQQVTVIGDICDFPFLECTDANTRISTFETGGNETFQIIGEFAPFCDFSVFNTLDFLALRDFNDLVGELPSLECLPSLVSLSLGNNNLSGSMLDKGITNMANLGFLDLSDNAFEGNIPNIQNESGLTTRLFGNQFDFVPESWTVFKRNIAFNPISVLPSTCAVESVANTCQPRTLPRIFQSGNTLISKSDNFPLQWKNISTNTTYPNATGPFTIPCHGTYTVTPDAPNILGSGETVSDPFAGMGTGKADTLTIDLVDNQVALSDGQNLNIHDLVGGTVLGTLTWGTSPGSFPNAASTPVTINENTTLYVRDETAAGCVSTAQIDIRLATQGPAVYVDDSATGNNNGTSWADAYTSLQDGLAFESPTGNGAEIWVAAGTYYPDEGNGYTDGDRTAAFQLRNNMIIYGGFAGNEPADFDVNQRDIDGNPTILSGDIDKDGLLDSENSLHVIFNNENGVDKTAVLDGFTISGGFANGKRLPHERGGGMFNKEVAPTVRNCIFTNNEARHNGGAIFNYTASPNVINTLFYLNTANLGGAVYNYFHAEPVYANCTFANNIGLINGAGIYNNFYANTTVNNAIIWGNTGVQVFNNASTLSITDAIIEGGCPAGYDCTNVSDQDPEFVNSAAGDFRLLSSSPAIDGGAKPANLPATDLDGNARILGGRVDMGAYEAEATIQLAVKGLLEGAYNPGSMQMSTDLASLLPITEPFSNLGYTLLVASGEECVTDASVFTKNTITDWVLLELRSASDNTQVVATRAALLQQDGDVVDLDGVSPVGFTKITAGNYYIVLRHRSHLGVMTAAPISLDQMPKAIDFTDMATPVFANGGMARKTVNGTMVLIAGDASRDGEINAVDINQHWLLQNGQPYSYFGSSADFNLDGEVNSVDYNTYLLLNSSLIEQLP